MHIYAYAPTLVVLQSWGKVVSARGAHGVGISCSCSCRVCLHYEWHLICAAPVEGRESIGPVQRLSMGVPLVGTVTFIQSVTPRRRVVGGVQHFGKGHLGSNEL